MRHAAAVQSEVAAQRQRSASDKQFAQLAQVEEMFRALLERERAQAAGGTPRRRRLSAC